MPVSTHSELGSSVEGLNRKKKKKSPHSFRGWAHMFECLLDDGDDEHGKRAM